MTEDNKWTGYVVEKGEALVLSNEEYDTMIVNDYVPRVVFGEEFMGFLLNVDMAIELMEADMEDLEEDEEEYAILKSTLEKLKPFKGKTVFLP